MDELETLDVKEGQPKTLYLDILSYPGSSLLRVGNLEDGELSSPSDPGFERSGKGRVHHTDHCLDGHTQELRRSGWPLWDQEHQELSWVCYW